MKIPKIISTKIKTHKQL